MQNKVTTDIKAMILGALTSGGGQEWLEQQMKVNPTAFMTLIGKIIPTQITGANDGPIKTESIVTTTTAQEAAKIYQDLMQGG